MSTYIQRAIDREREREHICGLRHTAILKQIDYDLYTDLNKVFIYPIFIYFGMVVGLFHFVLGALATAHIEPGVGVFHLRVASEALPPYRTGTLTGTPNREPQQSSTLGLQLYL